MTDVTRGTGAARNEPDLAGAVVQPARGDRAGGWCHRADRLRAVMVRYLPLLIVALAWELMPRLGIVSDRLLPPMSRILHDGYELFGDGTLYRHAAASLSRAFAGFGLALVVGVAIGVLMAVFKPFRIVVNPLVQVLYPIPKSALIPIMMIWLGIGAASKITIIFLGCMLPVTIAAFNGARGVDKHLLWSARSMGASEIAILWEVILPAAMPEILAGIRTGLALCFMLLVGSELLIANDGLGYMIEILGSNGVYPKMFAVIFIVVGIGFAADRLHLLISRKVLAWQD